MTILKYLLKKSPAMNVMNACDDNRVVHLKSFGTLYYIAYGQDVIITDTPQCDDDHFEKEPIETQSEGLFFFKPKVLPTLESLCLNKEPAISVPLSNKFATLLIKPCVFQAQTLLLAGKKKGFTGVPSTEYGQLGYDITKKSRECIGNQTAWDEWYQANFNDIVLRFLYLAIENNYKMTPELLACYNLFSADDIEPLLRAGTDSLGSLLEDQKKS